MVRQDRAGRSLGPAEARCSFSSQTAPRRLRPDFVILNFGLEKAERAAASPREGPLLASASPLVRSLRKLRPELGINPIVPQQTHLILNIEF